MKKDKKKEEVFLLATTEGQIPVNREVYDDFLKHYFLYFGGKMAESGIVFREDGELPAFYFNSKYRIVVNLDQFCFICQIEN